jgi:arginine N-succinyltransferase
MPKHPIYVSLLSKDAQKVINEVHPKTLPALRLLEAEGFARRGYVDIFDGGPTVESQTASVKTVRNSNRYQVIIGDIDSDDNYIICNTKIANFRAVQAPVSLRATAEQVVISASIAEALQVNEGDVVRLVQN